MAGRSFPPPATRHPPPCLQRNWLHEQSHVGPGRFLPHRGRPQQQAQAASALGRQLQPPKSSIIQSIHLAQHGGNAGAAQRLIASPQHVGCFGGTYDNHPLQIDAATRRRRGVEISTGIDHDQNAALVHGLPGRRDGQGPCAGSLSFGKPFNERAAPQAIVGEQTVESVDAGGNNLGIMRPIVSEVAPAGFGSVIGRWWGLRRGSLPRNRWRGDFLRAFQPAQLLRQLLDNLAAGIVLRHNQAGIPAATQQPGCFRREFCFDRQKKWQ